MRCERGVLANIYGRGCVMVLMTSLVDGHPDRLGETSKPEITS